MYCPAHFQEDRPEAWLGLIEHFPLGTVITSGPDGLNADHIPLQHVAEGGAWGKLIGHVARANPLWQLAADQEVLVVFQGPSAYISPNWYATKQDGGKVVPTWNYAVVHAHARLKALHEPAQILGILNRLTHQHERTQAHPWQVSDAPTVFTDKLLPSIVGIELSITRMQGKWKVSQNQPQANRQGVVQGLLSQGTEPGQQMADLVKHG
ncbi:MAG TPA: FMN-binding negative transcriptional regulator [Aquabacterium sp.]|nr:FMN-binding negative transcriptional regulator [Aquabacterium sp.]